MQILKPRALEDRTDELAVYGGAASALGFGGVAYFHAFSRGFLVEAGIGGGLSGFIVSAMPKVTLGSAHDRFVAGLGPAISFATGGLIRSATTAWLNVDALGYERRFDNGLAFSITGGATVGLAGKYELCFDYCEDSRPSNLLGFWSPQGRIGFGYWF